MATLVVVEPMPVVQAGLEALLAPLPGVSPIFVDAGHAAVTIREMSGRVFLLMGPGTDLPTVRSLLMASSSKILGALLIGPYAGTRFPGVQAVVRPRNATAEAIRNAVRVMVVGSGQAVAAAPAMELSHRPAAILRALAAGMRNAEIVSSLGISELGISEKTVRNHIVALYQRIGVRNRAEAVRWAVIQQQNAVTA